MERAPLKQISSFYAWIWILFFFTGFAGRLPAQAQVWESRVIPPADVSFTATALSQDRAVFAGGGKAYVYERQEDGTWVLKASLEGSNGRLGKAVAMTGNVILAEGPDECVYTFERQNDGSWPQVDEHCEQDGTGFGSAIKLDGNTGAFGLPGFDQDGVDDAGALAIRDLNTWAGSIFTTGDTETPDHCSGINDPNVFNCENFVDFFGYSGDDIAVSGNTIMFGVHRRTGYIEDFIDVDKSRVTYASFTGKVYVLQQAQGQWTQSVLTPEFVGGVDDYFFGSKLAVLGKRAIILAGKMGTAGGNPETRNLEMHIYEQDASGAWSKAAILETGQSASFTTAGVGLAEGRGFLLNAGKIHIYEPQGDGSWAKVDELLPGNGMELGGVFDSQLAVDDTYVATIDRDGAGHIFDHTAPAEVAVTDFSLIDANGDAPIAGFDPLPAEVILDRTGTPPALSIRANTGGRVSRVVLDFKGEQNFRTEFFPPYTLFGDVQRTDGTFDYTPAPEGTFESGTFTITATPYDVAGVAGPATTHTFTVKSFYSTNPRVYYPGPDNHVHELAWFNDRWHQHVLKVDDVLPPAAAPGSALMSYGVRDADNPRVYYLDTDNHVNELAWFNEKWHWRNLNVDAGNAPAAAEGSALAGFDLAGNYPRVYYLGQDNHVHELAWFNNKWNKNDITFAAGNAPAAITGSALMSFGVYAADDPRVYYVGRDEMGTENHVYELAWYNDQWNILNLNVAAGNALAAADGSALAGFVLEDRDSRVYYLGTDNHVHELAWFDEQRLWKNDGINVAAEALPGSALLSFGIEKAENPRVYFIGANNHVNELAWYNEQWHVRDLNADAGNALPAAEGSTLTGFALGDTNPRVYYLGADNQVHELAWFNDQWNKDGINLAAAAVPGSGLASFELRSFELNRIPNVTDVLAVNRFAQKEGATEMLSLEPAYPNPFNPVTTIQYNVPVAMHVRLAVYDVLGREVAVLVDNTKDAGVHVLSFDASGLSSGVYFYTLQTPQQTLTKRLLLAK